MRNLRMISGSILNGFERLVGVVDTLRGQGVSFENPYDGGAKCPGNREVLSLRRSFFIEWTKLRSAGTPIPTEHGRLHIDQPMILTIRGYAQFTLNELRYGLDELGSLLLWKSEQF